MLVLFKPIICSLLHIRGNTFVIEHFKEMVLGFSKAHKFHRKLLSLWSQIILKSYFLFLTWLLYHLHI